MINFVIVVDAQRDFMMPDGALYVAGAEALIAPMNDMLASLSPSETAGVLLTFDTHEAEPYARSDEGQQFALHCVRGSKGSATVLDVGAVDPEIPLYTLEKGVFAMWEEADVTIRNARDPGADFVPRDEFFDRLQAQGVEEIVAIGVAADFCVRWAVEGLIERGFRISVPAALTRGIVRQIDAVAAEEWSAAKVAIV
ncbi:cysteine hydrolase family protein [Novosphingobium sp. 9U]|uniref:cysteine hydrolase family protein n=1 Tax=Novosphingobium sp. 9U TaxID=2653158 RepID=UPI0012F38CAB|nr:isochorismatase family protein [Novosphingobium sp. 9U]VWX48351.1 Nicotinamidase-related amidase [Novosphingobium sp. 9U]